MHIDCFEKNWIRRFELDINEKKYSLFKKAKEIDNYIEKQLRKR